ncbi:DUF4411 family protein [Marinibaculum pumilum]|uniref:DUF4411 family protein n=1 Tax=Marinibaculum pumilum TaxID=1766165 RepID=A0ABV7L419_9PROT
MYSIDTSALLDGLVRHYPIATFPGLWSRIDDLIQNNRLKACEMVKDELDRRDDDASAWIKARPEMVVPIDTERQPHIRRILATHPRLVDTRRGRSTADPFVIALAMQLGCPVVTGEAATGVPTKPNIPDVCQAEGIECITFLQLIQRSGWVFR